MMGEISEGLYKSVETFADGVGLRGFNENQEYSSTNRALQRLNSDSTDPVARAASRVNGAQQETIRAALRQVDNDVNVLDKVVASKAQLSRSELAVLAFTALTSGISPFIFSEKMVEVLVPTLAAVSAAIGLSAEYVGKSAVANGKEIAALTIQAAAEAEQMLAGGERAKAIIPLCVGVATTSSVFSLLAPALIEDIGGSFGVQIITAIYLASPLVSVLAAATAGLAIQETRMFCSRATGLGNRRFSSANGVGLTWLSAAEQIQLNSDRLKAKFATFAFGTLPAPLLAALCPGPLSFKAVVCATTAAGQAAYYLSVAEYEIARAMDAVALKTRTAAVADAYANQGMRNGAILPFTSALGGLCAAATAAIVELVPLVHQVPLQSLITVAFPACGSLFAAAASVSKARCEVDAAAASAASNNMVATKANDGRPSLVRPLSGTLELIRLTVSSVYITYFGFARKFIRQFRSGVSRASKPPSAETPAVA